MNKLRLVIVDDEPPVLTGLRDLFDWNAMGYEVVGAFADSREALAFWQVHPAHVLLTDVRMPVLNGLELAGKIKAGWPKTEIVFLSAHADFSHAQQGLSLGARDYLVKPVQYGELQKVFMTLRVSLLPDKDEGSAVEAMKAFVAEHLAGITLAGAAAAAGLNPDYASRLFHRQTGVRFADYVHETKMDRAAELLRDVTLRVGMVAALLGYRNEKNFMRAFRAYYGMSPSQFRRDAR